jgi:hypothetical protein
MVRSGVLSGLFRFVPPIKKKFTFSCSKTCRPLYYIRTNKKKKKMGTRITKEIEIELEYNEVRDAVNDLSNREKATLIEDCELGEDIKSEITDDLSSFIDENCSDIDKRDAVAIIQSVLENLDSDTPTSDVLNKVISELDEDVASELNVNVSGEGEVTQTQKEFLQIVARYMDEKKMKKVVEKQKEGSELLEGFLEFLAK